MEQDEFDKIEIKDVEFLRDKQGRSTLYVVTINRQYAEKLMDTLKKHLASINPYMDNNQNRFYITLNFLDNRAININTGKLEEHKFDNINVAFGGRMEREFFSSDFRIALADLGNFFSQQ
jgi:hypothetical protein